MSLGHFRAVRIREWTAVRRLARSAARRACSYLALFLATLPPTWDYGLQDRREIPLEILTAG